MERHLVIGIFALALGSSLLVSSQIAVSADKIFRSKAAEISFRYPDSWVEKQPLLQETLVHLHASDGSLASCNVIARVFEELVGLSEQQLNIYRQTNHTREYFEQQFKGHFQELKIVDHWRGYLGKKDAGFVEYTHLLLVGDTKVAVTAYTGATFANGRRYVLMCNAPAGKEKTAREAFDYIRSTMLFLYGS